MLIPMKERLARILVVCTANVCCSPMAESVIRAGIAERGLSLEVRSAGVHALHGEPAHPESVLAIARAQLPDISNHRSRPVTRRMLEESDFVLCMEHAHRDTLIASAPAFAGRIKLFGHWLDTEIADPVDEPAEEFDKCLMQLNECTQDWLTRLERLGLLT
jgi:protein-tyrosine phosphatase